jgi:predicted dithiol-disulfide oxidoreductase (DUF899 family)
MTGTEWWTELKSITLHTEGDQPPMWPAGASQDYRAARLALAEAERRLRDQAEAVAAQRRALPDGVGLPDYPLLAGPADLDRDGPASTVRLTELFDGHAELVVYHLMFHPEDEVPCPMCSMWVDGLAGVAAHLSQRAGLAVIAKAPLARLRTYGRTRRWHRLRLVSALDSPMLTDLGVEGSQGGQFPAFSVFRMHGDQVRHVLTQSADYPDRSPRGIDLLSPVWNAFDLLPSGRGDWLPNNIYPVART